MQLAAWVVMPSSEICLACCCAKQAFVTTSWLCTDACSLTYAVHIPLIVLTPPAASAALKTPALGQSEPLNRQRQTLAFLQDHSCQRWCEFRSQSHPAATFVLQQCYQLFRTVWLEAWCCSMLMDCVVQSLAAVYCYWCRCIDRCGLQCKCQKTSTSSSHERAQEQGGSRFLPILSHCRAKFTSKLYSCSVISSPAFRTNSSSDSSTGASTCSKANARLTAAM